MGNSAKSILAETKYDIFTSEYVKDFNGTRSAIAAGYSKKTAGSKANQLLKLSDVQQMLKDKLQPRLKRYDVTQENILRELSRLAFSKVHEGTDPDFDDDDNVQAAISHREDFIIESADGQTHRRTQKVKMYDKTKALELLGKFHNLWKEDKHVTVETYSDFLQRKADEGKK